LKFWQGSIELPADPGTGERRRKYVRSKDKKVALAKLQKLHEELAKRGDMPTASETVEVFFTRWLNRIVPNEVRPKTAAGYRSMVVNHVIPAIGKVRLDKLQPAHIRRVHDAILDKGFSSTHALSAHRIMSSALTHAFREGIIGDNPAKRTKPPAKSNPDLEAFDLEEGLRLLEFVSRDPVMGARWASSLLTGGRRGEIIGLELDRIKGDELDLSWQLQRLSWSHGCGEPVGNRWPCGVRWATGCPDKFLKAPADFEYRRLTGGLYLTRPKSSAGTRVIPMFEPLRSIIERHMDTRTDNKHGLLFTREDGHPIDPDQDSKAWREVLAASGIQKDVRLHDLRHTTVDLLFLAGVPEDVIVEIVGHSTRAMTRAYKSSGNILRRRAAMQAFEEMWTTAINRLERGELGA
jgi:integrase